MFFRLPCERGEGHGKEAQERSGGNNRGKGKAGSKFITKNAEGGKMGVQRVCDPLAGRCARRDSVPPEKQ